MIVVSEDLFTVWSKEIRLHMGYKRRTKAVLIAEQVLEAIKSGRRLQ